MKKISDFVYFLISLKYKLQIFLYKILYRNVKWGINMKFYGSPIFRLNGKCSFGENLIFTSNPKSNLMGLNKRCSICILSTGELRIDDCCGFSGISIFCSNKIIIGKYCNFGGNSFIWDTDFHSINYMDRRNNFQNINSEPIQIGDDVFVGGNSIILKGVTIGDRAIIGAGSIVTKNIPADEVWAGNPIRFIKKVDSVKNILSTK